MSKSQKSKPEGKKPAERQEVKKQSRNYNRNHGRDKGRQSNRREQATKDSLDTRVNMDNARVGKLMRLLKADNDATWYTRNPELLKSATQLPFATIAGGANKITERNVPGIMLIDIAPAFGSDSQYPVALNQAGKATYSYMVHANSRNYQYEYQDLMILIVAAAQVFAAIAAGERIYGLAKYYLEQNRYIPEDLITALGFDPADIRQNLGSMWFGLNELIARTNQIWIPNNFPVIQRWMWLNSNVYVDSAEARAQLYCFRQQYFFKYDPTLTETGGGLVVQKVVGTASSPVSWSSYYQAVSAMIDALINDEDRGMIFGDILNAYGSERIYSRPPFSSDYTLAPVYSQEVLTQIENLTIGNALTAVMGLAQDTNGLKPLWRPAPTGTTAVSYPGHPASAVLNFHPEFAPTSENIAVATRLQALGTICDDQWVLGENNAVEKALALHPSTCGTEIVTNVQLINCYYDAGMRHTWQQAITNSLSGQQGDITYNYTVTGDLMAFDWHPFVYVTTVTAGDTNLALPVTGFGDFDNYIWITVPEAQKIHDTCVYSLFGLPIL